MRDHPSRTPRWTAAETPPTATGRATPIHRAAMGRVRRRRRSIGTIETPRSTVRRSMFPSTCVPIFGSTSSQKRRRPMADRNATRSPVLMDAVTPTTAVWRPPRRGHAVRLASDAWCVRRDKIAGRVPAAAMPPLVRPGAAMRPVRASNTLTRSWANAERAVRCALLAPPVRDAALRGRANVRQALVPRAAASRTSAWRSPTKPRMCVARPATPVEAARWDKRALAGPALAVDRRVPVVARAGNAKRRTTTIAVLAAPFARHVKRRRIAARRANAHARRAAVPTVVVT
jgi:hypothetical protein